MNFTDCLETNSHGIDCSSRESFVPCKKKPMVTPLPLEPGNTIGIVAPARSIEMKELRAFIAMIAGRGYTVRFGRHLFGKEDQFSGSDKERRGDLEEMVRDPEVNAVIAARGGYGTVRILSKLDPELFRKHPKWVVGYSDISALHAWLNFRVGVESVHGPMPYSFAASPPADEDSFQSLFAILEGNPVSYAMEDHPLNNPGKATGTITGGNLSVLYSLAGTPMEPDYEGAILFLEEVDEYLYHIDRMLMNFELRDVFRKITGLVVGDFTRLNDNPIPFGTDALEMIAERAHRYNVPALFGFPGGHETRNRALIFGRNATLTGGEGKNLLRLYRI